MFFYTRKKLICTQMRLIAAALPGATSVKLRKVESFPHHRSLGQTNRGRQSTNQSINQSIDQPSSDARAFAHLQPTVQCAHDIDNMNSMSAMLVTPSVASRVDPNAQNQTNNCKRQAENILTQVTARFLPGPSPPSFSTRTLPSVVSLPGYHDPPLHH